MALARASVSEAALRRPNVLSGALSEQLTNQRLGLRLQPGKQDQQSDGAGTRYRVVTYVHGDGGEGDQGGLQIAGQRKKPLGLALNPRYVESYVTGVDLDRYCREVQNGVYWRDGDCEFFQGVDEKKRPFLHRDLFMEEHVEAEKAKRAAAALRASSSGENENGKTSLAKSKSASSIGSGGRGLLFGSRKQALAKGATTTSTTAGSKASKRPTTTSAFIPGSSANAKNKKAWYMRKNKDGTVVFDFIARVEDHTIYPKLPRDALVEDDGAEAGGDKSRRSRNKQGTRPSTAPATRKGLPTGHASTSAIAVEAKASNHMRPQGSSSTAAAGAPPPTNLQPLLYYQHNNEQGKEQPDLSTPHARLAADRALLTSRRSLEKFGATNIKTSKSNLNLLRASDGLSSTVDGVYRSRRRFNAASRVHETRQNENTKHI
ncbi:unnamed protein product [Amoebophrya sp. A25]|nr:unnamed protein product [Amoebophrya sp. A25]|eukprot:GSA25T00008367001.1